MSASPLRHRKNWSVLVYLAGDNDLSPSAVSDVLEISKGGASPERYVSVQLDTLGNKGILRYEITEPDSEGACYRTVIERLADDRAPTGMPALRNFARWGFKRSPGERYMLVVWGHGGGWSLAPDKTGYGSNLDAEMIAEALRQAGFALLTSDNAPAEVKPHLNPRKLDVLALDACLMATVENAHHLRDQVEFFVGSQTLVPLDGFPYAEVLSDLDGSGEQTRSVLKKTICRFVDFYNDARDTAARVEERRATVVADAYASALSIWDRRANSIREPEPENQPVPRLTREEKAAITARLRRVVKWTLGAHATPSPVRERAGLPMDGNCLSATETELTAEVVRCLHELGKRLKASICKNPRERGSLLAALRGGIIAAELVDHRDLLFVVDMVHRVYSQQPTLIKYAENLKDAVLRAVVYRDGTGNAKEFCGLSVWFPTSPADYLDKRWLYLRFRCCSEIRHFGWLAFLDEFHRGHGTP